MNFLKPQYKGIARKTLASLFVLVLFCIALSADAGVPPSKAAQAQRKQARSNIALTPLMPFIAIGGFFNDLISGITDAVALPFRTALLPSPQQSANRLKAQLAPSRSVSTPLPVAPSFSPPPFPSPVVTPFVSPRLAPLREIVREVVIPVDLTPIRASLSVTNEELRSMQNNFTLLRGDLRSDVDALKVEILDLKAKNFATPAIIRETVVQIATPPGAAFGSKEITASIESGGIAPSTMTIGSMTLGGSSLASIQTINSSPTITGTLTISGAGTSTVASSLQVASFLTSGNLLTVPYFTATSTTATSTLAAGGLAVGTSQFVVQQTSGNVGINTSTPVRLLSVHGGSYVTGTALFGDTLTATSTALLASQGGNVGIGTTSPFALLSVNAPTGQSSFGIGSSTATYFVVDPKGNVGIGSTSPTQILSVQGSILGSGTMRLSGTATSTFDGGLALQASGGGLASANGITLTGGIFNSSVTATSSMAGGLALTHLAASNGLTITGGILRSTITATSTFDGGLAIAGLSSSNGLTVTGGNLLLTVPETNTAAATSTWSGGISTAGLASSNGITLTGGILNSTVTATSSMAGGLSMTNLAVSDGLTITGGSLIHTGTATSSFAGGISAAGLNSSAGLTLTGGIFNSSITATSSMAGGLSLTTLAASNGLTITGGSLLHTGTATSSFAGGIATAGLSSSDGLTLTGGNVLYSAANFIVQSGGNVGIGTTSPGKLLALDGSAAIRNALNVGGTLKATSTVFFTGLTANTAATSALCSGTDSEVWVDSTGTCDGASSRRFKYDIEPLGSALERVMALTPVSFKYHGQEKARYGFIAEDVLTIDPTVVALDAEGNSAGLYYKDISILAIKALQELNVKLDALTAQSGSTPTGNLTVASIESATNRWSLDENGGLVVQDLEVRGEGITIYDRDTKQPYCIGIASGEWFKEPGVCGNTAAQSPSSSNVQEQDQSSSDDGADNAWSNVPAEEENGAPGEEDEDDVNAALGS